MEPIFFELDEILEMHRYAIERFGGASGVRDMGLLESAIAMPGAGLGDERFHRDVFEMAAAYLFHIVQNHPFVDGNKRVGVAAAVLFLTVNGVEFEADEEALEKIVRGVAEGKLGKPKVSAFFREHGRR